MLLINTLRTGVELLTDVGVGQSIVNNPRGNEPAFYNTAWTVQIIRGIVLFILALALSVPVAEMYENSELKTLLPVVAPIFVLTGFTSVSRFLLQKRIEVRKLAVFDLAVAAIGAVVQIALAAYSPTIWALISGLLISTAISTVASFFIIDWRSHRIRWDVNSAKSILHFGKWIFLSTLIYFLAMNFDRLYFADVIPIALLGGIRHRTHIFRDRDAIVPADRKHADISKNIGIAAARCRFAPGNWAAANGNLAWSLH